MLLYQMFIIVGIGVGFVSCACLVLDTRRKIKAFNSLDELRESRRVIKAVHENIQREKE